VSTLVSGLVNPYNVAAAPSFVFWTAQNAAGTGVGLDEVQVDGGAPLQLGLVSGAVAAGGLAIDAQTAYVAVSTPGGGGAIESVPLAGGPTATVWATSAGAPTDIALGAGAVYWLVPAASPLGAVWSEAGSGPPAPLVSGLDSPAHLAVDAANAYWTSPGDGAIYWMPLAGGTPVVLASNLVTPLALVVDDAVYFTTIDGVIKLSL